MKKKIIILCMISFIIHFAAVAQCIIINSKPGNCMSCMKALSLLDYNKYPIYFVFEENEIAYKDEIEQQFKNYDIKVVFSDYLYKLTTMNGSAMPRLALLDERTHSVFNISIDQLDDLFVSKNIDNYFTDKQKSTKLSSSDGLFWGLNYKYIYNYSYGILKVYDIKNDIIVKTLTVDSLGLSQMVKHLNVKDSTNITNSFNKIKFDSATKPKFESFFNDEKNNKIYLTFNELYLDPDDTSNLSYINYLAVMDSTLNVELFKIEIPNGYFNYTNMVLVINDSTFLLNLYNDSLEAEIAKNQSVKMPIFAKYHLVQSKLEFQEFYDVDLPTIYKEKFKHNYMSLYTSYYPYVALYFSNTIINLENNKKVDILSDSQYTHSVNNKRFDYFRVKKLLYNPNKNQLLCFYSLGDNTYVNKYDDNLQLIESYLLKPSHFTDSRAYHYNDLYRTIGIIYDNNRFFLPVDVF